MKKKEIIALRSKEVKDLSKLVTEKKNEIEIFYARIKAKKEKNMAGIKNIKRDIARILSIIREKELQAL